MSALIVNEQLARRLVLHEARVQEVGRRSLRDLGDGWLLHDPIDAEPFWNRIVAPIWAVEAAPFARRLDEIITLFATLDRLPHVRPLPIGSSPPDLAERLVGAGFRTLGRDRRMVLADPEACRRALQFGTDRAVEGGETRTMRDYPDRAAEGAIGVASDAAVVLTAAFGISRERRAALEADVLGCADRPGCRVTVLYLDDEPVAVARATAVDGLAYLSSIATRPGWRGRGLGKTLTAMIATAAVDAGASLVHLAVEADNELAIGVYQRLGFVLVGDPVPDLLLT